MWIVEEICAQALQPVIVTGNGRDFSPDSGVKMLTPAQCIGQLFAERWACRFGAQNEAAPAVGGGWGGDIVVRVVKEQPSFMVVSVQA